MKNEIAQFGNKNTYTQTLITESDIIMRGGAAAPDFIDIGAPNPVNKDILRIIDTGINDIIINIKAIVGNTNETVDQQYTDIVGILNTVVAGEILNRTQPPKLDNTNFIDLKRQNPNGSEIIIENLSRVNASSHKAQIQNRLNNCHYLEKLYIKKHSELITAFEFIRKLFDKYKYAIKLVLYLLKSLKQGNEPVKVIDKTEENARLRAEIDSLRAENARLRAENELLTTKATPEKVVAATLHGQIAELQANNAALREHIAALERQNAELQATHTAQDVEFSLPPAIISNIAGLLDDQIAIQTNITKMSEALNNPALATLNTLETTAERL